MKVQECLPDIPHPLQGLYDKISGCVRCGWMEYVVKYESNRQCAGRVISVQRSADLSNCMVTIARSKERGPISIKLGSIDSFERMPTSE